MTIITATAFRKSMGKYIGMAHAGEKVLVTSRNKPAFTIVVEPAEEATHKKAKKRKKKTPEERFYENFRQAVREMRAHERGEIELQTWDEFYNELQSNPR